MDLSRIMRRVNTFKLKNEKELALFQALALISNGRRGGIRTRDPLHPMQVRYQAALHAEAAYYSSLGQIWERNLPIKAR